MVSSAEKNVIGGLDASKQAKQAKQAGLYWVDRSFLSNTRDWYSLIEEFAEQENQPSDPWRMEVHAKAERKHWMK